MGCPECFVENCGKCIGFDNKDAKENFIITNGKLENKNNFCDDESQSSESSSLADILIIIIFNGNDFEFYVKEKYDLSKVLYKFKKRYNNLKPKGQFIFNNKEIDDLSKTCGELKIRDGEYLILI